MLEEDQERDSAKLQHRYLSEWSLTASAPKLAV